MLGRSKNYIAAGIFLLAVVVRLAHFMYVRLDVPTEVGGLYVEFSRQIARHGFLLPDTIPYYSKGGIPFLYMPLSFYLLSIFTEVFNLDPTLCINLLPPLLSILSVVLFSLLIRKSSLSESARLYALLGYVLMPLCFWELVESAGLAEAMGNVMLILFMIGLVGFYRQPDVKRASLLGITFALCVSASPGSAMGSVAIFLLLGVVLILQVLYKRKPWVFVMHYCLAGLAAMLVSTPYWLLIMYRHGLDCFLVVFMSESGGGGSLFQYLLYNIMAFPVSAARFVFIPVAVVTFLGLLSFLSEDDERVIFGVALILCLAIPREVWVIGIFVALAFGEGVRQLVVILRPQPSGKVALAFMLIVLVVNLGWTLKFRIHDQYVTRAQADYWGEAVDAAEWIQAHVGQDQPLIILTDQPVILEWFPYLSKRTVLNMWFGTEWEPREQRQVIAFHEDLRTTGLGNLSSDVQHYFGENNFILVVIKPGRTERFVDSRCVPLAHLSFEPIGTLLYRNPKFLVYEVGAG